MRLSTIKLAGFKSFVEPTKIPFPDQMTCVVGPNGCGKSNVIDAVRWVLGESSAKNLRGDAMTDVIFNGSTNRKPISQASVELIFDNTQGHLPNTFADRNQVAIKRLVTRDGQSLYFLNGSKCRKRDITDIFLGTGLGPRSYAIIEQGMISRLIESKPADLRVFLEEAAGVSKYKERRRETQTRIKSTRENLERLLDVRKELQAQVDKLAVQSVEAKKYRELKTQERTLKGQLAVLKWQKLHQQQVTKADKMAKLNEQISFFKTAHSGHDDVLATLESQVQLRIERLNEAQQKQHQIHTALTRVEQQQIGLKQQQQALSQNLIKQQQIQLQSQESQRYQNSHAQELENVLQSAIEHTLLCTEQVNEVASQVALLDKSKAQSSSAWQSIYEQFQSINTDHNNQQNVLTQHIQSQQYIKKQQDTLKIELVELSTNPVEQQVAQQQQLMQSLTQELASKQTTLNKVHVSLQQAKASLADSQQRHDDITQQLNENKAKVVGLNSMLVGDDAQSKHNMLAQLCVKTGYEHLIEHALQGLEHLNVTKDAQSNAVWPISLVARKGSLAALIESGVYPELLHRIAYKNSFTVDDLIDDFWLAVIDAQGNMYGRNWHQNTNKNTDNSLLIKHKQLADAQLLESKLTADLISHSDVLNTQQQTCDQLCAQMEELKGAVHQLAQQIAAASTRRDMLKEQQLHFKNQQHKLQGKLQLLDDEFSVVAGKVTLQEQLIIDLTKQKALISARLEQAKIVQQQSDEQFKHINAELERYKTISNQATLAEQKARGDCQLSVAKLQHAITACDTASEAVTELTIQLEDLVMPLEEAAEQIVLLLKQNQQGEIELKNLQIALGEAKTALADKQVMLKGSQEELVILQDQLQQHALEEQSLLVKAQLALEPLDELQQNLKDILAQLPEQANATTYQGHLNKVTQSLSELGAVNLAAIDEFEQAQQRSQYLEQQLEDLTKALSTLEGAIAKIDRETKNRFKTTFDQVNHDFGELFPKVFGGGSAYLELTSDDLLESGVSIMARPPGKKNSTIHLLSGGEKALTALSLVFSIFRLNPAPFCMLDEVDAPLDDANVGRFCRLVEEMSQSVQFIYISHNKIAMEMAGRLTGVTMAEPGVSRMVAVDIEQAVQMAHA
ncbi:chromosome segregation SMC family protein [Pseudoalteromonas sp. Ld20]|uniref:chromosome segregation SMC family protein n=1 Tax=Pseudoalteromonas sp. Ld20 TaxID=649165 RepID=UPI00386B0644